MDPMDSPRPDPDALLAQLRQQEARAARGRLRIYFGASAGVGKTCAMLAAAQQRLAEGVDVLAGVVETHGRAETAALLVGLPLLPPAQVVWQGRPLAEFDLDGVLARRPALVLVDELAHANVPGARHPKRWQDVEELLNAGIDVYSTLNVQHLDSLNSVVGGITGIVVHETLPDTVFDAADEVVLVDTPADELLARLAAGKVYLPAQAERAARHFFRKGNLMALRELALRRTADRVEGDVQAYRSDRAIAQVWQTGGGLLCAVGPRPDAAHVVRSAARLAQQLGVPWQAVFVETPALQRLGRARRDAILQTLQLAQSLGARTAVLPAQQVAPALVDHARAHNLARLVLGRSAARWWLPVPRLSDALAALAPDVDRIEVGQGPAAPAAMPPARPAGPLWPERSAHAVRRALLAALICAATTAVSHALVPFFDLANIVMVFLLAVVLSGVWLGRGPAVLAALLNVAAFDFFFVPPRLSFTVSDAQYLLTFAVMLVVGLVVGQLTAGLRFQARVATHRAARSRALFEAARDLSATLTAEQVVDQARAVIGAEFRADVVVLPLDADERLRPPAEAAPGLDLGAAQWVLDQRQHAGLGTDTLAGSAWLYLPLLTAVRSRGVLALRPSAPHFLQVPEQREQLDTFAALTALALERVHYVEVAQSATVQMASERLRNSLLAALSHDLRTPLAALVGLAETLGTSQPPLAAPQQALAAAMVARSRHMAEMVTNLLDMARIQSGEIQLRTEWQSLSELVAGAVRAVEGALGDRPLTIDVPADLPLVACDAVLIERVLANLLENAGKYTPPGTPVTVAARLAGADVELSVRDQGPGVPAGQEAAIFEKFTRGTAESPTPGMGLGLAIGRAIVQAHGGQIGVAATPGGGATFRFTLPRGTPPVLDIGDDGGPATAIDTPTPTPNPAASPAANPAANPAT
jgi:two-component system sensor histidine kinase KdpD